jgi:hypothetical protein
MHITKQPVTAAKQMWRLELESMPLNVTAGVSSATENSHTSQYTNVFLGPQLFMCIPLLCAIILAHSASQAGSSEDHHLVHVAQHKSHCHHEHNPPPMGQAVPCGGGVCFPRRFW